MLTGIMIFIISLVCAAVTTLLYGTIVGNSGDKHRSSGTGSLGEALAMGTLVFSISFVIYLGVFVYTFLF